MQTGDCEERIMHNSETFWSNLYLKKCKGKIEQDLNVLGAFERACGHGHVSMCMCNVHVCVFVYIFIYTVDMGMET